MNFWLFDNDMTLYDSTSVSEQFMEVCSSFLVYSLGVGKSDPNAVLSNLKAKHNTEFVVMALMAEYGVSFDDIVKATYLQLDLSEVIINPGVIEFLEKISQTKVIFTANPSAYAKYVLGHLGLLDHFKLVVGMEQVGFREKHRVETIRSVMEYLKIDEGSMINFVDDSIKNLDVAKECGWRTFLYDPKSVHNCSRHLLIHDFSNGI